MPGLLPITINSCHSNMPHDSTIILKENLYKSTATLKRFLFFFKSIKRVLTHCLCLYTGIHSHTIP